MKSRIYNTIENLIIATVTLVVMNYAIVRPLRKEIKEQFRIVATIAAEPRYSISNDFEKMRTKKAGTITLDINNDLKHLQISPDTIAPQPKKQNFIKRIFNRKK